MTKQNLIEKMIAGIVVPVIVITILIGFISVTFTAASQINQAVSELSSTIEICAAELNEFR